jgi:exodeoxyribonuclease V alpha subunit
MSANGTPARRRGPDRGPERLVLRVLEARFGPLEPAAALALTLVVRATEAGHAGVDLHRFGPDLVAELDAELDAVRMAPPGPWDATEAGPEADVPLPDPVRIVDAVRRCPAVHVVDRDGPVAPDAGPARPFVLDGALLATHRDHRYEERVVAALLRRRAAAPTPAPRPDARIPAAPEQDAAVATLSDAGVRAGVGVLAGGPGTGKTRTVAALVAARLAGHTGTEPLRVALAAPTGRAADRLQEALARVLPDVRTAHGEAVAAELAALRPSTVHALLGIRGDASGRRAGSLPLPHDLVVVDEASMLSLPLAAELLDALDPATQLVLVGDPGQLRSVETGAVLRSLVEAGLRAPVRSWSDGDDPAVAVLAVNHRRAADPALDALVAAVRDGDVATALDALRGGGARLAFVPVPDRGPGAEDCARVLAPLLDPPTGRGGLRVARRAALDGDVAAAVAALAEVRLLCGHRTGPSGVGTWNRSLRERLAREVPAAGEGGDGWIAGEPVLVRRNDRAAGLVNGDAGVVVGVGAAARVVIPRSGRPPVERPLGALADVDPAFAVTVHTSQGSEYPVVVVLLPPADSPLATRELLYTALTRTSDHVVVVGAEAAVAAAVASSSRRMGGLGPRLHALADAG